MRRRLGNTKDKTGERGLPVKEISVFDIIGPNMIGPSSSHTAGALRIALIAGKLAPGRIVEAEFTLYGSFARTYKGHGTDRALLAGLLGFGTQDERIRDSFSCADKAGLRYRFTADGTKNDLHPNTVDILLRCEDGTQTRVRGVSVGGGSCRIERINGVEVSLSGDYATLIIRQKDTAGVVARITAVLGRRGINIAFMRLYRESRGQTAYSIIEADGDIPSSVAGEIGALEDIESAMLVQI